MLFGGTKADISDIRTLSAYTHLRALHGPIPVEALVVFVRLPRNSHETYRRTLIDNYPDPTLVSGKLGTLKFDDISLQDGLGATFAHPLVFDRIPLAGSLRN